VLSDGKIGKEKMMEWKMMEVWWTGHLLSKKNVVEPVGE